MEKLQSSRRAVPIGQFDGRRSRAESGVHLTYRFKLFARLEYWKPKKTDGGERPYKYYKVYRSMIQRASLEVK